MANPTRALPRAMPWTLLSYPADMMLVVPAFSSAAPSSAEIVVLEEPPAVLGGRACRLALRLLSASGAVRMFALDEASREAVGLVEDAPAGSVVVVEEDAGLPSGRRFAYVAQVRLLDRSPKP